MKYLDEFRDPQISRRLVERIRRRASRRWTLMEVCGGQTHSLLRHGIDTELADVVEMIHGPGCPVCVTPAEAVDAAIALSRLPDGWLTSFGDMLRVPGSRGSLLDSRASGGRVQAVYSPLDAVELARQNPARQVIFFAVGFETTAPTTALAVQQAARDRLDNFSMLVAHVRVLPAMLRLAADTDCNIDGFLAAGHVCTVTGTEHYDRLATEYGLPVVVTGFEPVDLLQGIATCIDQLEAGRAAVINSYGRSVRETGNLTARQIIDQVYQVVDAGWRGFGEIPAGGLRLREPYRQWDARHRFADQLARTVDTEVEPAVCRSGDVLAGRIKPTQCEAFGNRCRPESPLGAPMVSSEGACAAYFRYAHPQRQDTMSELPVLPVAP